MYPGPVHWSPSTYDGEGANDVCSSFKRDPSPLSQGTLWHLRWQIFSHLSGESQETVTYIPVYFVSTCGKDLR